MIGCNIALRPQDSVSLSSCAQIAAREAAHQWSLASLRGRACGRPPRWRPAYALGRHTDVGHWDLSPEWFGTQAGGWGRGAGEAVFQQQSELGNGEVGCKPDVALIADAEVRRQVVKRFLPALCIVATAETTSSCVSMFDLVTLPFVCFRLS